MGDDPGDDQVRQLLRDLIENEAAVASRVSACDAVAGGLAQVGLALWVSGAFIGGDRVSGESPFGFGQDRAVGIATVAQIGGELARGAVGLLGGGNRYAASALLRQLVEIEYLAHAFAIGSETAEAWLRADRQKRRTFWSPKKVRDRASGEFPDEHYWSHCERGGHPTTEGMSLLHCHTNYAR